MNPVATLVLKSGKMIKIELYPEVAPNTVANFIYLSQKGFFDGMGFCRVVNGRLIQSGDLSMKPEEMHDVSPGYLLAGEFNREGYKNALSFKRGVVGMAMGTSEISPFASAGSFFIMTRDEGKLDFIVPSFGVVIEGMEEVDAICGQKTHIDFGYDAPYTYEVFETIRVETYGELFPEPIESVLA